MNFLHHTKKKGFFFTLLSTILAIFLGFTVLFAVEVDVQEVQKGKRVKFINYRGRLKVREPVSEIRLIGGKLARGSRRVGNNRKYRYHQKYSVIHAYSAKEKGKFAADIISIDRNAKVGHIKNVRRILSGFYQTRYAYTRNQADTLSVFTTYYNAVYRGNLKYFKSQYKTVVMRYVNRNNVGLSTKYYEWPGRTKIIIPLTEQAMRGKLDAIDTDIISGKRVIKEIRKDGKHLKERKEMVKIREEIADKDKDKLARDKEQLKRKKDNLAREKQQLQKQKEERDRRKQTIREKEKQIRKEKEEARQIKDPNKRKEKEREVERKEKQVRREKEKDQQEEEKQSRKERQTEEKEQQTEREEQQITQREEQSEEKDREIQEEKEQISRDEKQEVEKEDKEQKLAKREKELDKREDKLRDKVLDKNIYANKLYYLKIREYLQGGHYNNELFMINAATKKIDFKSSVANICGRRYDVFSDGIVVITHRGNHVAGHRLTLVDRKSLKTKVNGTDDIFWRSFVEVREGSIYAITKVSNDYYLGKFDNTLKRIAKSSEKVNENTFISFYNDYIYINRYDKKIIVLKKSDLSLLGEIQP